MRIIFLIFTSQDGSTPGALSPIGLEWLLRIACPAYLPNMSWKDIFHTYNVERLFSPPFLEPSLRRPGRVGSAWTWSTPVGVPSGCISGESLLSFVRRSARPLPVPAPIGLLHTSPLSLGEISSVYRLHERLFLHVDD